ncbi:MULTISPECIES: restriction endonuclease subunit S [Weeksellaceae]|uniref:restriction endonuclease subunit S n=1 Tax=Weeksellaceae TaxID=2762318 RepID=UPI0028AA183D|nr:MULTISPECIES: restriction endonuclease subunit S [Weeksellaceae]
MTKTTQYKNTAIGPIPTEWEVKKLGEEFNVTMGQSPNSQFYNTEGIGLPLIQGNADIVDGKSIIRFYTSQITKTCEKDELIFTVRAPVGEMGIASYVSCLGRGVCSIKHSNSDSLNYIKFYLESYKDNWSKLSQGSTFEAISGNELKQFSFPLPPLPEQQKIAEVLSTWDKAIQDTDAIIKKLEDRNKALAFSLLRGKMVSKNSKEIALSKFLTFTPREIDKPTENYLALGIRSHGKGLFHKPDSDPKAIAMDKLYEVKENDFIVNITFAWEHAVAIVGKEDVGGLVSHRFPTYEIDTNQVKVEYFRHLILQPFFRKMLENISPGGAGRNRVLSKKDLLKLKVLIPTLEEQDKVAEILNTANQEVKQYQQKLEALKLQKKGLMQQLLTGRVRTV